MIEDIVFREYEKRFGPAPENMILDLARLVPPHISTRPLFDDLIASEEERKELEELILLTREASNGREALKRLKEKIRRFPDQPVYYRLLADAYKNLNKVKEARKIILHNFDRFPDFLFARLDYADLLLSEKKYEEFEKLFSNGYYLDALYPERGEFNITEAIAFFQTIIGYFVETGQFQLADQCVMALRQMDPASEPDPLFQIMRLILVEEKMKIMFGEDYKHMFDQFAHPVLKELS